ncbi:MAG: hypothetical protein ABIG34_02850 [Candidatus Peregrinibacteria bacterium]
MIHFKMNPTIACSIAFSVKQRCRYFRSDVRNLLRQRRLGYVEESDAKDADWSGETADSAADMVNK